MPQAIQRTFRILNASEVIALRAASSARPVYEPSPEEEKLSNLIIANRSRQGGLVLKGDLTEVEEARRILANTYTSLVVLDRYT